MSPREEAPWRPLCRVEEIEDGAAREFAPALGSHAGAFAVRRGGSVVVYENFRPHLGVPLNWAPDRLQRHRRARGPAAASLARDTACGDTASSPSVLTP